MNRMTPEEIRDLMNAVIADPSAQLQAIDLFHTRARWEDVSQVTFHFGAFRYRIKPKARVIWVNEFEDGRLVVHTTRESAFKSTLLQIKLDSTITVIRTAVRYVEQPE